MNEQDMKWLSDNGFTKKDGDVYEKAMLPGVVFTVRFQDLLWSCDAAVENAFPFISAYGKDAASAVAKQAFNVCAVFTGLKGVVGNSLDTVNRQIRQLEERRKGHEDEMAFYNGIIQGLSPWLEPGVILMAEGKPVQCKTLTEFMDRLSGCFEKEDKEEKGTPADAMERVHVGPKEGETPSGLHVEQQDGFLVFSAREEVEVHKPGLYPTTHVRKNDTGIYDIWSEGYQATGEHCRHHMVAFHVRGDNFIDAVQKWYDGLPNKQDYGDLRVWTDKNGERRASLWGCELFDNETDAARAFG